MTKIYFSVSTFTVLVNGKLFMEETKHSPGYYFWMLPVPISESWKFS